MLGSNVYRSTEERPSHLEQARDTAMKAFIKTVALMGLALLLPAPAGFAQDRPAVAPERPESPRRPAFRQEELDQMLAPIALYPDSLLSQVLMAATYPLEVVQAARWARANPGAKGADAVKATEPMNWDPSVKSLVAFPDVLAMMNERLEWTEQLGEAFLAQQPQVMDTIQGLRRRAEEAGNLESDERMAVTRRDDYVMIEPADPQMVYVPYYNPRVIYGPWWWADYPPAYSVRRRVITTAGRCGGVRASCWGPPIAIVPGFFFGAFAWPYRHVTVVYSNFYRGYYARRGIVWARPGPVVWRHDIYHRRSVAYRQAVLQQQLAPSRVQRLEGRRGVERPAAAPTTQTAPVERSRRLAPSPGTGTERRAVERAPQRGVEAGRAAGAERPRSTGRGDAAGSRDDGRRVQPEVAPRPDTERQQLRRERSGSSNSAPRAERTQRAERAQPAERTLRGGGRAAVDRG